jgi:hypothetical protein
LLSLLSATFVVACATSPLGRSQFKLYSDSDLDEMGVTAFAQTLERVCIETVEAGSMTKDLALLIGPDQPHQTTQDFLASIDTNLQAAVASGS